MASDREVSEELHAEVKIRAVRLGITLKEAYTEALEKWLAETPTRREDRQGAYITLLKARLGWKQ